MRIVSTIIILIIVFLVSQYYQIRGTIKTSYRLVGINFAGLDLNSFVANQTVSKTRIELKTQFSSLIQNIAISNLNVQVYKNGFLLGQSTPGNLENKVRINLKPGIVNVIYQNFDIHLNIETIALMAKIQQKTKQSVDYRLSFKVFGIPFIKTGKHEI